MKPLLFHVRPMTLATGVRSDVRLGSVPSPVYAGLGGFQWEGAVSRRPRFMLDLMSPQLDGRVQTARGDFMVNLNHVQAVTDPQGMMWSGAPITVYDATSLDYANMPIEFTGIVANASLDIWTRQIILNLEVEKGKLDRPLLTLEFTGGGGLTGDADKRGTLMPAGFGFNENCEPLWFDATNNVGMLDGYGNLTTVHGLYEGGNDLGASFGNYATYALLVAAPIPRGRWATCLAQGLVRLGAPPAGRISCDATFRGAAGTGPNLPGGLIRRILETHAGIATAELDTASFSALDIAVPRLVHYWTKEQRQVQNLVEAISASCNATTLILLNGKIAVTRAFGGTNLATLNRMGTSTLPVTDWQIASAEEPLWRMRARTCRPGTVFSDDEILYEDDLEDKGAWSVTETYRQGHLVWLSDGSQWLYINATPTAGNAPPAAPATSNAYWQRKRAPTTAADLVYGDGATLESLKPAIAGATKNRTWEQPTDPALVPANAVVNGDVWIDNSLYPSAPKVTKERVGGGWVLGSNLVQSGPDIGVAAGATADTPFIAIGANVSLVGNSWTMAATVAGNTQGVYSSREIVEAFVLEVTIASTLQDGIFGVRVGTPNFSSFNYAVNPSINGTLYYIEGAAFVSLGVTYAAGDRIRIRSDGATVVYERIVGSTVTVLRTVARTDVGAAFRFQATDYRVGKGLKEVVFLPGNRTSFSSIVGPGTPAANSGTTLSLIGLHSDVIVQGNGVRHVAMSPWHTFYGVETVPNAASMSARFPSASGLQVVGLGVEIPASDSAENHYALSLYNQGGTMAFYYPGFLYTTIGTVYAGDVWSVDCDNVTAKFYQTTTVGTSTTTTLRFTWTLPASLRNRTWRITGSIHSGQIDSILFSKGTDNWLDNAADGDVYGRLPIANTVGAGTARRAVIDLAQGHLGKNLDNMADTAAYARTASSELTGGIPKLSINASKKKLGGQFNVPPIASMNLGYKWPVAPTYTADSAGNAVISLPAATALLGDVSLSYNLMTVGVTGTPGTTVQFQLYFDDLNHDGGTRTLFATTNGNTIYQANGRVWPGLVSVFFPTTGTSGGGGTGGGGGGGWTGPGPIP